MTMRELDGFTPSMNTAVRALIVTALRDGSVGVDRIHDTLPEDRETERTEHADIEANLRLALEDSGVFISDGTFTSDGTSGITGEDEARFGEAATEVLDFLGTLQSDDADPLVPYVRSLPADRLTRDDEIALGRTIEEGMCEVLAAIAGSPGAVARLLSDVRGIMEGRTPARGLFGIASAVREDGSDIPSGDTTGDRELARETGAVPVSDALLAHLRAISDLCQQREVDRSALAQQLFDAGLCAEYREELQSIAEQDKACRHAARRIRDGLAKANAAKRRLVEANLDLVLRGARKYDGSPLADRVQAGNIGLMQAVDKFDYRRGAKFSRYAIWWIKQHIVHTVADTAGIIRHPEHVTKSLRKISNARFLAESLGDRNPDADRIAALANLPPAKVRTLLAVPEDPLSMDDPGIVEEVSAIADEDTPAPEEYAVVAQMQELVRDQIDRLTPREGAVLYRRFGIDCDERTSAEVGREFGVTRARIGQIETDALHKLRHLGRTWHLRDVLP